MHSLAESEIYILYIYISNILCVPLCFEDLVPLGRAWSLVLARTFERKGPVSLSEQWQFQIQFSIFFFFALPQWLLRRWCSAGVATGWQGLCCLVPELLGRTEPPACMHGSCIECGWEMKHVRRLNHKCLGSSLLLQHDLVDSDSFLSPALRVRFRLQQCANRTCVSWHPFLQPFC